MNGLDAGNHLLPGCVHIGVCRQSCSQFKIDKSVQLSPHRPRLHVRTPGREDNLPKHLLFEALGQQFSVESLLKNYRVEIRVRQGPLAVIENLLAR